MWKKILCVTEWVIGFILVLAVVYGSYTMSRNVAMMDVKNEKIEVILDAGHGGVDPGKIGVNGAKEKDINLTITKKVFEILNEEGIKVRMTREEDYRVDKNGQEYSRIEDMRNRVDLINEWEPELVVSIHQNSYSDEAVKGAQVFYYESSEISRDCAQIMQEELRKVDPENKRMAKGNDTYYLLKNTKVPVIIVECGFLSNWEEAKKLIQDTYQTQIARAIVDGIKSYLETTSQNENRSV